MIDDDALPPKKKLIHEIGRSLRSSRSMSWRADRVLKQEIARLEEAKAEASVAERADQFLALGATLRAEEGF